MALRLNLIVIALLVVGGGIALWLWPDNEPSPFAAGGSIPFEGDDDFPDGSFPDFPNVLGVHPEDLLMQHQYDVEIDEAERIVGFRLLRDPGNVNAGTIDIAKGQLPRFIQTPSEFTLVQVPEAAACLTNITKTDEQIGRFVVTLSEGALWRQECGDFALHDAPEVDIDGLTGWTTTVATFATGESLNGAPIVAMVHGFHDTSDDDLRDFIASLEFGDVTPTPSPKRS